MSKRYPKVEVLWWDAVQEAGTRHVDEPLLPVMKTTIGYLSRNEPYENYINIFAEKTADDPDELQAVGCIPKGMIIEIKRKRG